jgi:hypothetical protein
MGDGGSVVVLHLMIVPGDEPRAGRMGRLEERVGLVEGVADPEAGERVGRPAVVAADLHLACRVFVDVVAEMEDEIEVCVGHRPVGGVEPLLPVLARSDGKGEELRARAGRWRRSCPPDRAGGLAGMEAVEVPPRWLKPCHLDMDTVSPIRGGGDGAAADPLRERLVGGDLPRHLDRFRRHPPISLERLLRQTRPEDHAIRRRLATSDAERERIGGERRIGKHAPLGPRRPDRGSGKRGRGEEAAPRPTRGEGLGGEVHGKLSWGGAGHATSRINHDPRCSPGTREGSWDPNGEGSRR